MLIDRPVETSDSASIQLCTHCGYALQYAKDVSPDDLDALRTGVLLSPADAARALADIDSAASHLDQVKEELHDLLQAVQQLREQKVILRRRLVTHQALLAPIRRLPPEILVEIFSHCGNEYRRMGAPTYYMPIIISVVCKRWRDLAFGSPHLWTDISFDIYSRTPYVLLQRLNLYLRNSGQLTLRGVAYAGRRDDRHPLGVAWRLLLNEAHRWGTLYVAGPGIFSSMGDVVLPRLQNVIGFASNLANGDEHRIFERAPALRSALIDNGNLDDVVPHLPWPQLDRLITVCTPVYARKVLPLCSNLTIWAYTPISIRPSWDEEDEVHTAIPYSLPCLHTLRIHLSDNRNDEINLLHLLAELSAPRLKVLNIEWRQTSVVASARVNDGLPAFLTRCRLPLRHVELINPNSAVLDWVVTVHGIQGLTLDLSDLISPLTDEWVALLAIVDGDRPRYLPQLEDLGLSGCMDVSGEALLAMVEARKAAGCGLKALRMDGTQARWEALDRTPETFIAIQRLVPRGFTS